MNVFGHLIRLLRSIGSLFRSRNIAGYAPPLLDSARTIAAPGWRRFTRGIMVALGLAIFVGVQLWLANAINEFWWWYIIAFVVIIPTIAIATYKPIVALIAWSIISPLGRHFLYLNTGSSALPPISFDLVSIYFLAVILAARTLVARKPSRGLITGEWLLLAFVAYVTISQLMTIQSTAPTEIMRPFITVLIPEVFFLAALYFVVRAAIVKKEHLVWLCVGMSIFGFILAVTEFYEHFTGNRWYSLIVGFGIPLAWGDVDKGRATGMFDHASAPATLIATGFFLTYHLAAYAKSILAKTFYYINLTAMAIGAYYTYTRNVYVCFILFALAMPFFAAGKRKQYSAIAVVLVLIMAIGAPIMLSDPALNYRLTNKENIEARFIYANTAINVIRHFPVFGVGYGNLNEMQRDYVASLQHWSSTPGKLGFVNISHNTYLTILAEEGVVGALLYLSAIIAFLILALKIRARLPNDGFMGKDFASILFISSVIFLFSIAGASIYLVPYVNFIFWAQFAFLVRLGELAKVEQSEQTETPNLQDSTARTVSRLS